MAAMTDFHGGFSKKCHQIAVAWRVWDGGAMAVVAVMAGWRKMTFFFCLLSAVGVGLTRPNPTQLFIQLKDPPAQLCDSEQPSI